MAAISSPETGDFQVGPLAVHVYGLMYAIGVFAAVMLTSRLWVRRGGSRELVYDVALWAFPAGLIGGRLYFIATSWSEVPSDWWGPLAVWKGGLSIWGGIALGTVVGVWRLRRARADAYAFMDVAAPGLLIAQAIGRIGNYFNQELFGKPTDLPGRSRSTPPTGQQATRSSPASTQPSSTSCSSTSRSPACYSRCSAAGASAHPASSRSTSHPRRSPRPDSESHSALACSSARLTGTVLGPG
jgi:prolipoprotein diacylglyceryl transferase